MPKVYILKIFSINILKNMNALTFFQSNPQLGIGFIAALLLSAMVFPDKGVQGWQRWGQFALSPIVFVITIGNVFQYDPTDSHAIINTGMRWLLQVLVVGGVGFLIGAGGYKLCEGGAAVANVAASVARDGVTHAKDRAARPGPSHSKVITDEFPAFSYGYRHPRPPACA